MCSRAFCSCISLLKFFVNLGPLSHEINNAWFSLRIPTNHGHMYHGQFSWTITYSNMHFDLVSRSMVQEAVIKYIKRIWNDSHDVLRCGLFCKILNAFLWKFMFVFIIFQLYRLRISTMREWHITWQENYTLSIKILYLFRNTILTLPILYCH